MKDAICSANVVAVTNNNVAVSYNARMNVIRFIAICSVVWGHSLLGYEERIFNNIHYQMLHAVMVQAGRVGTIMFFLVSGFLLYDKIHRYTPITYLRHRLKQVIYPWMVFLFLVVIIQLSNVASINSFFNGNFPHTLLVMWVLVKGSVFHAAYWFVPVAVMSALILVALKKHINKTWFGIVLAVLSLFHGINLYLGWIPVSHTVAVLGYIFYLWLGLFIKRHIEEIKGILDNFSMLTLCCIVVVVFWLACIEGINLTHLGCTDAYASLRLSNAELSVLLFIVLLKSNSMSFIDRFKPQQNTFGIYLIHSLVIMQLVPVVNAFLETRFNQLSALQFTELQLLFFMIVFFMTLGVVQLLRHTPLRVLLGMLKQ